MFERIERNDKVYGTRNGSNEFALGINAGRLSLLAREAQLFRRDVEADRVFGSKQGQLLHFRARAAPKIKNDPVADLSLDTGQQNPKLAPTGVSPATHRGRKMGSNQAQEAILKRGQHTGSYITAKEYDCR